VNAVEACLGDGVGTGAGVGAGRLNSPELRGGGGLGGSKALAGGAALDDGSVLVRFGGGLNLLSASANAEGGRYVSNDLRIGGSGGLPITMLFRMSRLSFRIGREGRSCGKSLVARMCFDMTCLIGGLSVDLASDRGSLSDTT
jgi:hypothetical protein